MRINYTGDIFGKLTVVGMLKDQVCECKCECGNTTHVKVKDLKSGTFSCGCTPLLKKQNLYHLYRNMQKSTKNLDSDINLDYLYKLYLKQRGRDYYVGVLLDFDFEKTGMFTASVDRINSKQHYKKGNIVLVCRSTNYMKNEHSEEKAADFIINVLKQDINTIPYFKDKMMQI